jgi:hypothetical protein
MILKKYILTLGAARTIVGTLQMSLDNGKFLPILGLSLFSVESVRLRIRFRPHLNLADPVNLNSVVGRGLFFLRRGAETQKKKSKEFLLCFIPVRQKIHQKRKNLPPLEVIPLLAFLAFMHISYCINIKKRCYSCDNFNYPSTLLAVKHEN